MRKYGAVVSLAILIVVNGLFVLSKVLLDKSWERNKVMLLFPDDGKCWIFPERSVYLWRCGLRLTYTV